MPLKKTHAIAVAAAFAALALGPISAAGAATTATPASCTASATSGTTVFSHWGDTHQYTLAPNGNFANNAAGWTLLGAVRVVPDNNPWNLSGSGSYALSMGPASAAISPPICVSSANPDFRFLYKAGFFAGSISTAVDINSVTGLLSGIYSWSTFNIFPTAWTASAANPLATLVSLNNGTATVRLVFTDLTTAETIGDVYIDPWAR